MGDLGPPDEDTLRVLIVTDTHLGYLGNDPIRGNDSFRALEEALEIGKQHKCDFVLHGGDLFEHNKPSKNTMVKTIDLLRKYTMGAKRIGFQVVSDQSKNFVSGSVNFEDPNMNIGFPIFMIHGNHDDPAGTGRQSALNVLSSSRLINYFGRADNVDEINLFPVLLVKGETKVALYGLGHIRDERLHRSFTQKKVKWVRPKGQKKEWFNMFCIHQNRTKKSKEYKNCIPEQMLPKFLDVVYWAHEHECLIELDQGLNSNFYVTQPGSPIVTSFCAAEARPKYVGIMDIRGSNCRLTPVRLTKNRPFIWDEIILEEHFELDVEMCDIEEFLVDKVNILIQQARSDRPKIEPGAQSQEELNEDEIAYLPLIRLRVEHSGFDRINPQRFGQQFVKKVANPAEIILCYKKKTQRQSNPRQNIPDFEDYNVDEAKPIKQIIFDMLRQTRTPLGVLAEGGLTDALQLFVDKEATAAITDFVKKSLKKTQKALEKKSEMKIKEDVAKFCRDETDKQRSQMEEAAPPPPASEDPSLPESNVMLQDESDNEEIVIKKQKVKKRKRSSMADDDDWEEEQQPKKKKKKMPVVKSKKRKPRKKRN